MTSPSPPSALTRCTNRQRDSEWLQKDRKAALYGEVVSIYNTSNCKAHLLSSSTIIRRKSSPLGRSEEPTRVSSHRSRSSASILVQ